MAGKLEIDFGDSLVRVRVALRLKRRVADEKLVCKHAKTPHINICIVRKTFDHLRRQVVQRAAQRFAAQAGRVHAPAEIGDLQVASVVEKKVFWLDVAVDHVLTVAIHQSMRQLLNIKCGPVFRETNRLLQITVQFSFCSEFKNQINSSSIVKITVESENVWMPEMTLNLNLAPQLVLHAVIVQLFFEKHLQGHHILALLLAGQVHIAELSLAKRFANVEVCHLPLLLLSLFGVALGQCSGCSDAPG